VKRCPTCNRSFDDDTLSFCLEDGTPLVRDAGRVDSQETLISPAPFASPTISGGALPPPPTYGQLPGKATISASQFVPPAPSFTSQEKPRRTWLWVVVILVIVFVVIGGIVIAAIFIPPMLRDTRNDNRAQPTPTRSEWTTTPTPIASPSLQADDMPEDEDEVLRQLTKLEDEWARANVEGDKPALERILADDYVGNTDERTKRQYIDSLKPDPSIKSWEFQDLTVDQTDDRATLSGTLREVTTNGPDSYTFVDTFVWRDHRWQAVASHTTRVK
jgi:hypothetical protein